MKLIANLTQLAGVAIMADAFVYVFSPLAAVILFGAEVLLAGVMLEREVIRGDS